jgi:hypothetical protein
MPDSVPRGLLGVFRASKKETIAPIPVKIAMFWDRLGDDAGRYPGLGLLAIGRHDGREDAEGSVSGDWRGMATIDATVWVCSNLSITA